MKSNPHSFASLPRHTCMRTSETRNAREVDHQLVCFDCGLGKTAPISTVFSFTGVGSTIALAAMSLMSLASAFAHSPTHRHSPKRLPPCRRPTLLPAWSLALVLVLVWEAARFGKSKASLAVFVATSAILPSPETTEIGRSLTSIVSVAGRSPSCTDVKASSLARGKAAGLGRPSLPTGPPRS